MIRYRFRPFLIGCSKTQKSRSFSVLFSAESYMSKEPDVLPFCIRMESAISQVSRNSQMLHPSKPPLFPEVPLFSGFCIPKNSRNRFPVLPPGFLFLPVLCTPQMRFFRFFSTCRVKRSVPVHCILQKRLTRFVPVHPAGQLSGTITKCLFSDSTYRSAQFNGIQSATMIKRRFSNFRKFRPAFHRLQSCAFRKGPVCNDSDLRQLDFLQHPASHERTKPHFLHMLQKEFTVQLFAALKRPVFYFLYAVQAADHFQPAAMIKSPLFDLAHRIRQNHFSNTRSLFAGFLCNRRKSFSEFHCADFRPQISQRKFLRRFYFQGRCRLPCSFRFIGKRCAFFCFKNLRCIDTKQILHCAKKLLFRFILIPRECLNAAKLQTKAVFQFRIGITAAQLI